jgi:hypothetical protein
MVPNNHGYRKYQAFFFVTTVLFLRNPTLNQVLCIPVWPVHSLIHSTQQYSSDCNGLIAIREISVVRKQEFIIAFRSTIKQIPHAINCYWFQLYSNIFILYRLEINYLGFLAKMQSEFLIPTSVPLLSFYIHWRPQYYAVQIKTERFYQSLSFTKRCTIY